jgi:kinesin family protein 6/9
MQEKASYKAAFSQLRSLKGEIEHLQLLLEQSRKKLQQDFQQWLGMVARQQEQHTNDPAAGTLAASISSGGRSRLSTASRQYGRSSSSSSSSSSAASKSSTEAGQGADQEQQLPSGSLPRSSSGRTALRKSASTVTPGSLLHDVRQHLTPRSLSSRSQVDVGLSTVDPKLLQAAAPHLTGDPEADTDIVRFYEAKEKLLQMKLGTRPQT